MSVNKVEVNGETVLDLSQDSVTPEQLVQGATAHNAAGEQITGTYTAPVTSVNGQTGDVVVKSAYAAAQDGGYTGTETAFNTALADVENKAAKAAAKSVTLTASGWGSNKYQSLTVPGVQADSNIIITAAPGSYIAYAEAGVRCAGQANYTLAFKCEEIPTADLVVNVLILG